jgi:ubiquinone/menaquinone biosynthesis C-methylase UbiE
MLAEAKKRVERNDLDRVRLIEADAERFDLPEPVDAILCFLTHDILLSATALPSAMRLLKPGGRVVAAGVKLVRGWRGWLINPITIAYSLPAVSTRDAARSYEPYAILSEQLDDLRVEQRLLGSHYVTRAVRVT